MTTSNFTILAQYVVVVPPGVVFSSATSIDHETRGLDSISYVNKAAVSLSLTKLVYAVVGGPPLRFLSSKPQIDVSHAVAPRRTL